MSAGKPRVLILCGTRHRPADALRMVRSVQANTSDVDWRLAIGDASDAGRPAFRCPDEHVHVQHEYPRRWMSGGLNDLVRGVTEQHWFGDWYPEWVTWLNDDAEVEPRWAFTAVTAMIAAEYAGQNVGMGALPYLTPHPPAGWHVNYFPDPALPYANFGFIRLEVWQEVGGFDERVPFYGCDNAFAFRIFESGRAILPIAGSRVVHHYAEDDTRQANAAANALMRGWDEVRTESLKKQGDWRALQGREIGTPPGFALRNGTWVELADADATYIARYGRETPLNTADAATV